MLEAIVIILGVILGVGGLGVGIRAVMQRGVTSPKFNVDPALPAPEPSRRISSGVYQPALTARAVIPKDIADELNRAPEWWDSQFHKAMAESGAGVVVPAETVVEETYGGHTAYMYVTEAHQVLDGCTCSRCS